MDAEVYWQKVVESGWTDCLSPDEREALRRRVEKAYRLDPRSAYCALAAVLFDEDWPEEAHFEQLYHSLVVKLAEGSRGKFRPDRISVYLDEERDFARVSFEHRGRRYRCTAYLEDDGMEDAVLDLVNDALEESGETARYIVLPVCGDVVALALAPDEVYDRALEMGIIPPDDDPTAKEGFQDDPGE